MKRRSAIRDLCGRTFWGLAFAASAIAAIMGAPSGVVVGLWAALVVTNVIVLLSAR
jgi:hypothetical protein